MKYIIDSLYFYIRNRGIYVALSITMAEPDPEASWDQRGQVGIRREWLRLLSARKFRRTIRKTQESFTPSRRTISATRVSTRFSSSHHVRAFTKCCAIPRLGFYRAKDRPFRWTSDRIGTSTPVVAANLRGSFMLRELGYRVAVLVEALEALQELPS